MLTIEQVEKLLKESGCDAYELTDEKINGWEFYFIRHELDQNRVRVVENVSARVYKKIGEDKMGVAKVQIRLTSDEETAKKQIEDAVYEATLAANPVYELNKPCACTAQPAEKFDVQQIAEDFIKALQEVHETTAEDVNSYEIFVEEKTVRFLNSNGIDIEEHYPSSMIEVVVNARKDKHEIELYRMFRSGTCDQEELKKSIEEAMRYGKDKLIAEDTPALGKAPVVFSTSAALSIYQYFLQRLDPAMLVRRFSDYKIGTPIAEDIAGDKVTIETVLSLPNSNANSTFDEEGAPIRAVTLMQDSVPQAFTGGRMFSSYLGLENTFLVHNWKASGGTKTEDELRTGNFLEVVEFSAFHVNAMTGDIAGEIRLGYWHENGKVTPVSGGSVSGSMHQYLKNMYMSKEQKQYNSAVIPSVTRLEDVSIAGIEK